MVLRDVYDCVVASCPDVQGKPRFEPVLPLRREAEVVEVELLEEFEAGDVTVRDLAEDYGVDRATIYRTINRAKQMRLETNAETNRGGVSQ